MTSVNPIVALESLGYTEREAAFLYLVAIHSGYFVRRQFNQAIQRQKGYLAQHFIEKARIAGHIEVLDYRQGRFLYHLFSKPIYRLLGNPESQNRRRKGDAQIQSRLMVLDYVLENKTEHYLETDDAKLDFFGRVRGVSSYRSLHPFLRSLPISLTDPTHPATSVVRFPFIDEGLLSMKKFSRFLTALLPLFASVGTFEVIYAAPNNLNFATAQALFYRTLSENFAERQQVLGDFREVVHHTYAMAPARIRGTFTRLLLRKSYPNLLRFEPRGSVEESELGSSLEGVTT
jgi:hypothetical protein